MKNSILTLFLVLAFLSGSESKTRACDGALLSLNISELYFDENGKWQMELYYETVIPTCEKRGMDLYSSDISLDSAVLTSGEGKAKLKFSDYFTSGSYYIITADSLNHEILIDQQSDSLCLVSYFNYYGEKRISKSILIYGDRRGSRLSELKPGQSFIFIGERYYCKTNIPTLGQMNNANLGTYAFLKGKIFDKDNNLVRGDTSVFGVNSFFYDFWLKVDSFGNYTSPVYSRIDTIYKVTYIDQSSHGSLINIIPIPFNLEPDSVLVTDIHLLGALISSNKSMANSDGMDFYPNPVKEKITFKMNHKYYGNILIINIKGNIIQNLEINAQEDISWQIPQNLENGIYLYKMMSSGETIGEGKFVLAK